MKILHIILFFSALTIHAHAKDIEFIQSTASLSNDVHSTLYSDNSFAEDYTSFSVGGFGVIGNWVIGGEGIGIIDDAQTLSQTTVQGYGLLKGGYMAYSDENTRIFPMLGVGGGEFMVYNNGETAEGMLVDVSIGILFAQMSKKTMLAVNMGYLHSMDWQLEGDEIAMSVFYLNFNVGGK